MEALQKRLEAEHKAVVDAILRRYYGPRCEKFDPRQLLLFGMTVRRVAARRGEHRRRVGRAACDASG